MKIYIMRKELGKWFMDIAKYMTTAVLLTSLFSDLQEWAWYLHVLVIVADLFTLLTGLILVQERKENKI